jgi:fucose 4-O-acetylase-like acetyltransferase
MAKRDYRLDKAKGILIFLVVVGHFLERISGWEMGYSRALLTAIYSFHMPAFVFLAGITAKSNRLVDRVLVFVVLVVATQPLYYYWMSLVGKPPDLEFDEPYWITWFLLAMVWWLLLLPLVERFPQSMLVLSISVGVLGGMQAAVDFQLSFGRAMTFFPFFVIGKLYGMRLIQWATDLRLVQKLGATVLALVPMLAFFMHDIDHRWFYGARGFEFLGASIPYGVGMRVLIGSSAMLTIVVLLSWANRMPSFLVPVGQRSLAIFILHGLIVRALNDPLDAVIEATSGSFTIALCLVLAAIVTLLLSWKWFDQSIRWFSSSLADIIVRGLSRLVPSKTAPRH